MNQTPPDPIAQQAYDLLAERYAEQVLTKPHNAYYERPAMLSLLPDVRGKRVLDTGCGPGGLQRTTARPWCRGDSNRCQS
ncbi:MAG: hypothetical protein D6823_10585 [Chloroflexi bacterium]|nr:MAG: hypothetical protein D6823_10585 [Chloroflexota bacterium]